MATPQDELDEMFDAQRGAGETLEFDAEAVDVEDTEDGGAIVNLGEQEGEPMEPDAAFYENLLAPNVLSKPIDAAFLGKLASDVLEAIDQDIESRKPRDEQYEEGLKRTGIGGDAPGGASFQGATKTTHPMIT